MYASAAGPAAKAAQGKTKSGEASSNRGSANEKLHSSAPKRQQQPDRSRQYAELLTGQQQEVAKERLSQVNLHQCVAHKFVMYPSASDQSYRHAHASLIACA